MSHRDYYNSLLTSLRSYPHLLVSLIALLPDEDKRTTLERIHYEYSLWESAYPSLQSSDATAPKLQGKWKGKEKAPKGGGVWDVPKKTADSKCPLCGDMIPSSDKEKHEYYHQHGSPHTPLSSSPPLNGTKHKSNGTKVKIPSSSTTSTIPSNTTSTTTTTTTPLDPSNSLPPNSSWNATEASFPSLTPAISSLASLSLNAWGGGKGRGPTPQQQDFPSLSSSITPAHANAPPQGVWGEREQDEFEEETLQKRGGAGKKKKQKQVLFRVG